MEATMPREFLSIKSGSSFQQHSGKNPVSASTKSKHSRLLVQPLTWALLGFAFAAGAAGIAAGDLFANYATFSRSTATFQIASRAANVVAVRFVVQATSADIDNFLKAYNASVIEPSRQDGYYRMRISGVSGQPESLAETVARMKSENIVDLIVLQ
jgi:hypothetical protein